jgi:hypothetical protein
MEGNPLGGLRVTSVGMKVGATPWREFSWQFLDSFRG